MDDEDVTVLLVLEGGWQSFAILHGEHLPQLPVRLTGCNKARKN
jgi:hypothetical protein